MNSIYSISHQLIALVIATFIKWALPHALNWWKRKITSEMVKKKFASLLNSHLMLAVMELSVVAALFIWVEVYFVGGDPATLNDLRHCFLAGFWVVIFGAMGTMDWGAYYAERVHGKR